MTISNAPANYTYPICLGIKQTVSDDTLMRPTDIVYSDDLVTVFINSFFVGKNAGHVIVVPNKHYEHIYVLPQEIGHRIFDVSQKMSKVMKAVYGCDGITIKQNNEPAGDQHAFHYHLHVFPRYNDDGFNEILPKDRRLASPEERAEYAEKLRGKY